MNSKSMHLTYDFPIYYALTVQTVEQAPKCGLQ